MVIVAHKISRFSNIKLGYGLYNNLKPIICKILTRNISISLLFFNSAFLTVVDIRERHADMGVCLLCLFSRSKAVA